MSQLKAKQLKLAAAGDLLIGGVGGTGTSISATGNDDKVLRVINGAPAWSLNDNVKSANGFNTAKATDSVGLEIGVQNSAGTAGVTLATFKSGSASDENFVFSSKSGAVELAAKGTSANIDIILTPKGDGEVIIGNSGGGIIQADDNEDLKLLGGDGTGNLILNGGGLGKVYYGDDATDASKEIATKGDIQAVTFTQTRSEYAGDASSFALNAKTVVASVLAHINGLILKSDTYTVNPSTKVVTFSSLPYALDSMDQVVFTYEITA